MVKGISPVNIFCNLWGSPKTRSLVEKGSPDLTSFCAQMDKPPQYLWGGAPETHLLLSSKGQAPSIFSTTYEALPKPIVGWEGLPRPRLVCSKGRDPQIFPASHRLWIDCKADTVITLSRKKSTTDWEESIGLSTENIGVENKYTMNKRTNKAKLGWKNLGFSEKKIRFLRF